MMAVLWSDVERDLKSARHHFGQAVDLLPSVVPPGEEEPDYLPAMAFMHAMQSGYTSFESAMKRLLGMLDEPVPAGAEWHKALVQRIAQPQPGLRPAILADRRLVRAIDQLRGFRHVATHVYDAFDPERATLAAKAAETFLARLGPALDAFRATIDPD